MLTGHTEHDNELATCVPGGQGTHSFPFGDGKEPSGQRDEHTPLSKICGKEHGSRVTGIEADTDKDTGAEIMEKIKEKLMFPPSGSTD